MQGAFANALSFATSVTTRQGGVRNIFANQFGILGLPETLITTDELYGAILCGGFFYVKKKKVPGYFRCLGKCCDDRFAVKLQKCFVDYETSPDFPSA